MKALGLVLHPILHDTIWLRMSVLSLTLRRDYLKPWLGLLCSLGRYRPALSFLLLLSLLSLLKLYVADSLLFQLLL